MLEGVGVDLRLLVVFTEIISLQKKKKNIFQQNELGLQVYFQCNNLFENPSGTNEALLSHYHRIKLGYLVFLQRAL